MTKRINQNFIRLSLVIIIGFLVLFLPDNQLIARHIIGGEITYECLGDGSGNNTRRFRIRMSLYRDCAGGGADFDAQANFGIYQWDSIRYTYYSTQLATHSEVVRVLPDDNPCLIIPPGICVESTVYEFVIDLPLFNGSYVISYSRCCRNNTITNIIDAPNSGATYFVEITDIAQINYNNSPVFNDFPPIAICLNLDFEFDHSASDQEGDQIVYSFCAPKYGGGPFGTNENPGDQFACNGVTPSPDRCLPPFEDVRFLPPFSVNMPMSGTPALTIDKNTGTISGVPDAFGQYVVGVCVTEFKDGKIMSEVRRDFQFNISQCEETVFAAVLADTVEGEDFVINSCGSFTVDFINESFQEQYIQNYLWEFDINGVQRFSSRDATVTFPSLGNYPGKMVINRGFDCADSLFLSVNVLPDIRADFEFDYDTCIAGPILFTDKSESDADGGLVAWQWAFETGASSSARNPQYLFPTPGVKNVALTAIDVNNCRETIVKDVTYFPVPSVIVVEPSTFRGCAPATIKFNNLSTPIDSTYFIDWDFGDGGMSMDISPTYVYNQEGTYSINVDLVSPIGCKTSASFKDWIIIRPGPDAGFTFSPEEPSNTNPTVSFLDQSMNGVSWFWIFDDGNFSQERSPIHTFQDTGIHEILQIVVHESGCTDTARSLIDIRPVVSYYLPNAFTPNNDAVNDTYFGKGDIAWMRDFNFSIWNRWGQKIFETEDPNEGWNGAINNVGEQVQNGVYVCLVRFIDPRGEGHEIKGFATVVR